LRRGVALGAVLAAYPAHAQDGAEGVKLKLGGYFKGYVNYVDQDEATGSGVRNVDILRQTEVHFDGKTTLDNGLTVGAHIEGRVDVGDDFAVDETYVFFSGDWGRVNFGATHGTPYILQVVAPAADSNIDGRLQMFNPVNFTAAGLSSTAIGETDYDHDVSAKSDKVSYISPMFSGFQAGISYTPEVGDASRSTSGNASDVDDTTASSDVWDMAVRYENEAEGFTYRIGAGYTHAQVETGTADDRDAWNIGADFDIGNFGVGVVYMNDDLGDADDEAEYWVVGADYKMGSVVYGASYYNKEDDVNDVDYDRYSLGATYKYGPGMDFRASVGFHDIEEGTTDAEATSIMVGTDIKF